MQWQFQALATNVKKTHLTRIKYRINAFTANAINSVCWRYHTVPSTSHIDLISYQYWNTYYKL